MVSHTRQASLSDDPSGSGGQLWEDGSGGLTRLMCKCEGKATEKMWSGPGRNKGIGPGQSKK